MMWVEDLLDAACEGKSSGQIPDSLGTRLQPREKARSNEYLKYGKRFTQLHRIQTKKKTEVIGIQTPFLICF